MRGASPEARERKSRRDYDTRIQKRYGITLAEYEVLLEKQGGGCAICGSTDAGMQRRFAVDHDHVTGRVRGILCHPCNRALGLLGDNPERVESALIYLRRLP